MKNIKCKSCESVFQSNLEFCPKCGYYNESSAPKETSNQKEPIDRYNKPIIQKTKEEVLLGIAEDISTIKSILVFFTALWGIGALIWIIILIS